MPTKVPIPTPEPAPIPADLSIAAKFARALAGVQPVHKTKTAKVSDTYVYRYASLGDTLEAVKAACHVYGLSLAQPIVELGDRMQIMTLIIDMETGDTLTFGGPVIPVKGEPQAMGSALSYSRRYALTCLFALNVEDDDGAQAQRAAVSPDNRTEAEAEVRRIGAAMDEETREQFVHDFKAHFGCTLRHLGESRHGDALAWSKAWEQGIVQEVLEV